MKYIFEKFKTPAIFFLLYYAVMVWGSWSITFFSELDIFPYYNLLISGLRDEITYLEPLFLLTSVVILPVLFIAYRYRLALKRPAGYILVACTLVSYLLLPFTMTDPKRYGWRPPVYTTNINDFEKATIRALEEYEDKQYVTASPAPAPDSPGNVADEVPTDPAPVPVVADESSTSEPPPAPPKKSSQPARAPSLEKKPVVEPAAAVKPAIAPQKTIDERYIEIGNQRCGTPDGIIEKAAWIVCTQPLRFELCKGIWSENPPPGQKTCRGSSNGN